MLDANKYIDRLRQTVKDVKSWKNDGRGVSFTVEKRFDYLSDDSLSYIVNRVKDIIRDYDRDFDKAMEEMEDEGTRRGRETAEYLKQLKSV